MSSAWNCRSNCSSVFLLVSGIQCHTKRTAQRPMQANIKKVAEMPMRPIRMGKKRPIRKVTFEEDYGEFEYKDEKVTIQRTNVDKPMAKPRTLRGNISDCISQVTGEIPPCWKRSPSGSTRCNLYILVYDSQSTEILTEFHSLP